MENVPSLSVKRVEFSDCLGSGSLRRPLILVSGCDVHVDRNERRANARKVVKDVMLDCFIVASCVVFLPCLGVGGIYHRRGASVACCVGR